MRHILLPSLVLVLATTPVYAQSVLQNLPQYGLPSGDAAPAPSLPSVYVAPDGLPPAPNTAPVSPSVAPSAPPSVDPYTVTDVNADVTADTAAHARDQALTQAEHTAFAQLCARVNTSEASAKISDDALAGLVQSFEVQSERLSAVRYIGVFTIRFKPLSTQRRLSKSLAVSDGGASVIGDNAKMLPAGPTLHMPVTVQTDSLAAWAQIKRRLNAVPQVVRVDTIDLGRGTSHVDLLFAGSIEDLQNALTNQGFVLRQDSTGIWDLSDNSMVPR